MRRLIAIGMAVAGAAAGYACGSSPGNPEAMPAGASSQQTRVAGEYLVTLAARAEVKAIADLYGRFGIKDIKDLRNNVFLVTLTEDPGPEDDGETPRGERSHQGGRAEFRVPGPREAGVPGNGFVARRKKHP